MAHSAHLYKVKSTYYFRVRVPKDLQGWFPRHNVKRSLWTRMFTSARQLVTFRAAKNEKLFTTIRAGLLAGIMTGKEIKKLIEECIGSP